MYEVTLTLPHKIQTHAFYGMDDQARQKLLLEWRTELHTALQKQKVQPDSYQKYKVTLDYYFKGTVFPTCECLGMTDLLISSLVECKILKKDSPTYISDVTVIPNKSTRKKSYVTIELN